jgi:peroxiredoxin
MNGNKNQTMNGGNGNSNDVQYTSRKWKLILLVVLVATVAAFLPPLVSAWLLGAEKPLVILSGTEWVSIVTISVGAYFGANVWQKHVQRQQAYFDPDYSGVRGGGTAEAMTEYEEDEDDANKEA